jgi:2OG-Fe(II) oxygenase superfamily
MTSNQRLLLFCCLASSRTAFGFLVRGKAATTARAASTSSSSSVYLGLEVGTDPSVYRPIIGSDAASSILDAATASLYETGYCILDNVLPFDALETLDRCLTLLDSGGSLQQTPEAADGVRDDCIRFNSEVEAMIPVGHAIRLLKGVAHIVSPLVSQHYYAGENLDRETEEPMLPANKEWPLTVPQNVMIAIYPDQGRYRIHSDNSRDTTTGRRRNWREITCILYVNPDWTEEAGGKLRLWPQSQDIAAEQFGMTDQGEQQLREHLKQQWEARHPEGTDGQEYVQVAPIAGRMVLFQSSLLHEVRPSLAESRRAITCWFNRPVIYT